MISAAGSAPTPRQGDGRARAPSRVVKDEGAHAPQRAINTLEVISWWVSQGRY
jgi:hypothetical protein